MNKQFKALYYGGYKHSGRLVKVERGWVYLDSGKAHSYRRIERIHFGKENKMK